MEFTTTHNLDGVILHSPLSEPIDGTLCVSEHHLLVSSKKEDVQEVLLLQQSIDLVEKKPNGTNVNYQNGGSIILKCKDLRIFQLDIASNLFLDIYASIEKLSNVDDVSLLKPFSYRPLYNILEDGYTLFKPEVEYAKLLASDQWRISHINKNYDVCPSYSATLIVPKSIDDETIVASANFRDGGRFPVLSYRHDSGAILLRSSQPMLNNSNRRCRSDEKILNVVLGSNKKGYIIDTRSANYASHCKSKGGGTEPDGHYPQWRRTHKGLDKIGNCSGALSESISKLIDACNDTNSSSDKWLSRVESSNWLTHVLNALNVACLVAQCLDQEGASVLVHGSSGLDSTLLVTSLAQVILNPDCRTVRGLQALIEREWLQAGYPFQTRHAKFCYSTIKNRNQQPTFLLFLDCVHQLHYQFPCSFEFTTQMLILLFENSYFSEFGTFLGNCEADKEKLEVPKKTTSLWSYLNTPDIVTSLLNPLYDPNKSAIWPSVAPVSLVLWNELYLRWVLDQSACKKAFVKIHSLIENDKNARIKVLKLRKQLLDLQREYATMLSLEEAMDDDTDRG